MPKKGGLGQFVDLNGGLAKKRGVFLRGSVDTAMHTMNHNNDNHNYVNYMKIILISNSINVSKFLTNLKLTYRYYYLIYLWKAKTLYFQIFYRGFSSTLLSEKNISF